MEDETLIALTINIDYRTLDVLPSPEEFFLLSRLKGEASVGHLCRASGLEKLEAKRIITKLIGLGLIRFKEEENFFEVFDNRDRNMRSESGTTPNPSDVDLWDELRETLELDAQVFQNLCDRSRSESEITKPAPAEIFPIGDEIWETLDDLSTQTTLEEISLNTSELSEVSFN